MENKFVKVCSILGASEDLDSSLVSELDEFTCCLYGKPNKASVNTGQSILFHDHNAPKCQARPLEKTKGTDACNFPPFKSNIFEKAKQANVVAAVYKRFVTKELIIWNPENHGWKLVNSQYVINWYEGRQVPEDVCAHIDEVIQDDEQEPVYYSSSDENDSDMD